MTTKLIRTYLDTGVIIRAFQQSLTTDDSIAEIFSDSRREFIVSDVLKLELFPKARFHKKTREVAFYQDFFDEAAFLITTTPALMNRAIDLASQYNLAPCDALHLILALEAKVDEFITTEKPEKPFFQVPGLNLQMTSIYYY